MQDAGPPPGARSTPFREGAVVLVSLNNPREKFWGAILELTPAGLSIRGIDLNSLEDCARLVKAGEPVTAAAVFFPMQRIERIEIDARNGSIPSLHERFAAKARCHVSGLLGEDATPQLDGVPG